MTLYTIFIYYVGVNIFYEFILQMIETIFIFYESFYYLLTF